MMIGIALASLLAAAPPQGGPDDGAVAYTAVHPSTLETYSPPAVRPFEPPSSFGAEIAQGDAFNPVTRRTPDRPVEVEAYAGQFEPSPSDLEIAYQQGVTSAALRGDDRMGPLDGRWRLVTADGAPLLDLLLFDPGSGREIEGAWRDADDGDGVFTAIQRTGAGVSAALEDGALTLTPDGAGWRGVLTRGGRATPVELRPVS